MAIRVLRTFDVSVCLSVISNPEIWKVISEDSATIENNIPDVISDYWLTIIHDDTVIGVVHGHQKWKNTIQCHIQILPEHRKFSNEAGDCIIKWILDNTEYKNIYTEVPIIYSNVVAFLESFGFERSGKIRDCYTKDQKITDVLILTKKIR